MVKPYLCMLSDTCEYEHTAEQTAGHPKPNRKTVFPSLLSPRTFYCFLDCYWDLWALGEVHTITFRQQAELKMLRYSLGVSTMSPSKGQLRV